MTMTATEYSVSAYNETVTDAVTLVTTETTSGWYSVYNVQAATWTEVDDSQ